MKRKHYKQANGYACGIYSLANMLQDKDIITDERIDESINGNNIGQLNKILLEEGYDCFIDKCYYKNEEEFEPFDLEPKFEKEPENVIGLPFAIVIPVSDVKNHMIGCVYLRDMSIVVHNSLKSESDVYKNFHEFLLHYPKVVSLEVLRTYKNEVIVCTLS